jgi:acyl-CoA thioester hydrolase
MRFVKELKLSDVITMHTTISKMTADASRWSIAMSLKNTDDRLYTITVDGAWMDTKLRN